MYRIQNAGTKGLGIFASQLIPSGTRILAEKPIFTVRTERDVFAASKNISIADRDFINGLTINQNAPGSTIQQWIKDIWDVTRGTGSLPKWSTVLEYQHLLARFKNNNFDIGDRTQAIFRDVSRLNHACVPNTQGNYNSNIKAFTIHTLRPIEPDEEITISYIEMFAMPRETRQNALLRGYGFECGCPACDMGKKRARDGERKRVALKERLARMHAWQKESGKRDYASEMELLGEMIKVFEAEGLAGRELGTM